MFEIVIKISIFFCKNVSVFHNDSLQLQQLLQLLQNTTMCILNRPQEVIVTIKKFMKNLVFNNNFYEIINKCKTLKKCVG